jgi:hypothetical protein
MAGMAKRSKVEELRNRGTSPDRGGAGFCVELLEVAIDWARVYQITKDFGVPLATFLLGMLVQSRRQTRTDEREEFNRLQDLRRADNVEREKRINRVLDNYVPAMMRDANESGAIAAGILALHDWTEYRDFCSRAEPQFDLVMSRFRRRGERSFGMNSCPAYFEAWKDATRNGAHHPDYDAIFERLKS